MLPSSPFEITRRDPAGNASNTFLGTSADQAAASGTTVAARGLALTTDPLNPENFVRAGNTNFTGHLTRDVNKDGLTLSDRTFGRTTPTPTGTAGPFAVGGEVTVEKAMEFEAEDPYILLSGTRSLSSATAPGTGVTFENGLVAVAQSGDQVFYTLTANNLQTSVATNKLRMRFEHV